MSAKKKPSKKPFSLRPSSPQDIPDRSTARRLVRLLRHGLCEGMGDFEPGSVCVEAAVCYAMGWDEDDNPRCVFKQVRDIKIHINDDGGWPDDFTRGEGLTAVAVAQLGTAGQALIKKKFAHTFNLKLAQRLLPWLVRRDPEKKGKEFIKPLLAAKTRGQLTIVCNKFFKAFEAGVPVREMSGFIGQTSLTVTICSHDDDMFLEPEERHYCLLLQVDALLATLKALKAPGCKWLSLVPKKLLPAALLKKYDPAPAPGKKKPRRKK